MKRSVYFAKPFVKSSSIQDIPMQKSVSMFQSAIKSEKTKTFYMKTLEKFREFCIIRDYDSLVSIGSKKLQERIDRIMMVCDSDEHVKLGYDDTAWTDEEKLEQIMRILGKMTQTDKEKIKKALEWIDSFLSDEEGGDDVIENWDGQTPRDLLTTVKIILTFDKDN